MIAGRISLAQLPQRVCGSVMAVVSTAVQDITQPPVSPLFWATHIPIAGIRKRCKSEFLINFLTLRFYGLYSQLPGAVQPSLRLMIQRSGSRTTPLTGTKDMERVRSRSIIVGRRSVGKL